MRVLIIKTSSLGDVIHTLPAVSDAVAAMPEIQFDWVVENNFAEIVSWHPQVKQIIPVKIRQWRKNWLHSLTNGEMYRSLKQLRGQGYDTVIDAQGVFKSALISLLSRGRRYGLDKQSSRGAWVSCLYQQRYRISWNQHAVERIRQLFAKVLGYTYPAGHPNYGIRARFPLHQGKKTYLMFFTNTTWESKFWPVDHWQQLTRIALQAGYDIKFCAINERESHYVATISQGLKGTEVIYQKTISELARLIVESNGVVSVDTGLGHLAAALDVATISLQGPTNSKQSGAYGSQVYPLAVDFPCAPCLQKKCNHPDLAKVGSPPCYQTLAPKKVWESLEYMWAHLAINKS